MCVYPFVYFKPQFVGDEGGREGGGEVIEGGAVLAANGEDIAKAFGGDEGGACAFAFEKGVGGDSGAVGDLEIGEWRMEIGDSLNPFEDGKSGVMRRGGEFEGGEFAGVGVEDDEIGEGAAGIYADS